MNMNVMQIYFFLLIRFVASCGFTPDVKVWEVCFAKSGEFKEVARAFDLKGHSAGVYFFDFSNDSRRQDHLIFYH